MRNSSKERGEKGPRSREREERTPNERIKKEEEGKEGREEEGGKDQYSTNDQLWGNAS